MIHSAQLSGSRYAEQRKELLELVKQLRAIGAQAEVDLPRIVVIGNQSAGKSSVVEAISGINVPRDSGTCTRCPMECRLTSSTGPRWSCQVSIRWEFDSYMQRKDEVTEVPFGPLILSKQEVELALRRAQAAVLNPHIDAKQLLGMSAEQLQKGIKSDKKPLAFSRNVVCVDLEGPDLTDLAFIDLPGIIQNAEPDIVKLVEDLVVSHIKGNSLILVALPMIDDIENQKALRLAHQEDPQGKRTIGVLTKPDMLSAGTKARTLWLDVIEGRRSPLLHGYYCTRQPDDAERANHISSVEARQAESLFFEKTAPWATSLRKDRFGTNNLVASLSTLLEQVIKTTMPKISAEASACLDACQRELAKLPVPLDADPATYMLSLITSFTSDIQRYVRGVEGAEALIQQNRTIFAKFEKDIHSTSPHFVPLSREEEQREQNQQSATPVKRSPASPIDAKPSTEKLVAVGPPFYLEDMTRHIEESVTRELPNNVPYPAKVSLIGEFQKSWPSAADECFTQVREVALRVFIDRANHQFERWDHLQAQMRGYIAELVKDHYERCRIFIDTFLEIEGTPYTQNAQHLHKKREGWIGKYKEKRAGKTGKEVIPLDSQKFSRALASLTELGYTGLKPEDLARLTKQTDYESEINIMGEVRAYFDVAYKRIIDNIPSVIDLKFLKAVMNDMQPFLIKKMALGTQAGVSRCERFLAEDPGVMHSRKDLTQRIDRLEAIKGKLYSFGM